MSTSQMKSHLAHFRAQLLAHEKQADLAIEHAYSLVLASIQPQLDKLYRQITAKQDAGEKIPPSWLHEERRLDTLKRFIEGQIDHFGMIALMQTGQMQHTGVQLGQQAASTLLQASVPPGVHWSFGVPPPAAIANIIGVTQAGSPLADLFDGFGREAADKAAQALIAGIVTGDNPRTIAPRVEQALGISRARALTISRDQMNNAYRNANMETYRANDDVVESWIWQAALGTACAACTMMNGTEHSLDETLDSHPNCRCAPVPKTKSWSDILGPLGIDTSGIPETSYQPQSGADWLDNQPESVQRQVLGAKYQGWAKGDFTLRDLVGHHNDEKWGPSIYEKSLKQLTKVR